MANEKFELAQRHVEYDVLELGKVAARAMNAQRCVRLKKFPDGLYNKALLLTMDNDTEVVAKIPNPNAGIKHFTTASEVATMEFVSAKFTNHEIPANPHPRCGGSLGSLCPKSTRGPPGRMIIQWVQSIL